MFQRTSCGNENSLALKRALVVLESLKSCQGSERNGSGFGEGNVGWLVGDVQLFADNILGPRAASIFRQADEYLVTILELRNFLANFFDNASGIIANSIRKSVNFF